jgi:predicted SAM-dependent methyltransferase
MHVQFGCGFSAGDGWRNFDASPTLRLERLPGIGRFIQKNSRRFPEQVEYGDIVRGLPVGDASCDGVYASHVLLRTALAHTHRILKPGGVFRLVVPDLEALTQAYLSARDSQAAARFLRDSGLGLEQRPRSPRQLASAFLGNSQHLWMWDYKALEHELQEHGFVGIRRCFVGDSTDPMFLNVEDPDRFEGALGIECFRPSAVADIRSA